MAPARGAATNQVHNREQNDCAQQRHEQRANTEIALVDGANTEQRRKQQTSKKRADDANDDVEQRALLAIRVHDKAGKPAKNATHNNPNNEINNRHFFPPKLVNDLV